MDLADYLEPARAVGGMSVGVYRNDLPRLGISAANTPVPVYYIPVVLRDMPRRNAWCDGRHQRNPARPTGSVACYDLRQRWETELNFAFHTLSFYVPQAAFDELTSELQRPRVGTLDCQPSSVTLDPVLYHLSRALLPVLEQRVPVSGLLADQMLVAVRFHLATRYGGLRPQDAPPGRLSARQIARLTELMLDEPWRNIRLTQLAASCGLPVRTFLRAFRRQFGTSPHQYRLAAKTRHARALLENTDLPLSHIAHTCGFSDQSHLTRVFSRITGISPALYRRARRS